MKEQIPFSEADLPRFRKRLLRQRDELRALEEAADTATEAVELDQARVGRLTRMDALQGQAMSLEAKRRREIELQRISAALERMEKDEYGYCLGCGEAIATGRLELDPAAPLCFDCANRSERS